MYVPRLYKFSFVICPSYLQTKLREYAHVKLVAFSIFFFFFAFGPRLSFTYTIKQCLARV